MVKPIKKLRELGEGTFIKAYQEKGKIRKIFKFPLLEETYRSLKKDHEEYCSILETIIPFPRTELRGKKLEKGKYCVYIIQEKLPEDGILFSSFLTQPKKMEDKIEVYKQILKYTLEGYKYNLRMPHGVEIGLESNPHNWFVVENQGKIYFFDSIPPLIKREGLANKIVLAPRENPSFVGKLISFFAHGPIQTLNKIMDRLIEIYGFDWPTIVRTLLVKTIYIAPKALKKPLIFATREIVKKEKNAKIFLKKLSRISIEIELLKLRIFETLASLGKKG